MGLKEWSEKIKAEQAAINVEHKAEAAARKAGLFFEGISLTSDSVTYKDQGGPLAGAIARVENAADARRRVTATRLLTIGVFAFAAKKQSGSVYLTVEHPDYQFIVEVPVKKETQARQFAVKINNAAKTAGR
jgi:hypothetical protein